MQHIQKFFLRPGELVMRLHRDTQMGGYTTIAYPTSRGNFLPLYGTKLNKFIWRHTDHIWIMYQIRDTKGRPVEDLLLGQQNTKREKQKHTVV